MFRSTGIAWTLAVLCMCGCGDGGPKLAPVTGVVKLDGTPKSKLLVTFTPAAGGIAGVGQTNEKGEFTINTNGKKGAVLGEHKVSVTTIHDAPETAKASSSAPSGGDAYMNQARIAPTEFKLPKELVPDRYNKNTELVRQVESSKNEFDFDLQTK
jgi:hypothetical protein